MTAPDVTSLIKRAAKARSDVRAILREAEKLDPAERLGLAVNLIGGITDVLGDARQTRAGAVLDLRMAPARGSRPLTWEAIGALIGESRQTAREWADQYQRSPNPEGNRTQ